MHGWITNCCSTYSSLFSVLLFNLNHIRFQVKLTVGDFLKLVVYIVSALSQLFILCWKGDQLNEIVSKISSVRSACLILDRFYRACIQRFHCTRAIGKVSLLIIISTKSEAPRNKCLLIAHAMFVSSRI